MQMLAAATLPLAILAALGAGMVSGLFFVFSNTIMAALSRMPPEQGMAAMQHINRVILNPVFLGIFVGTAVLSLLLLVWSGMNLRHPAAPWLLIAALAYLVGSFGLTRALNVPLNITLDRLQASAAIAATQWPAYVGPWLRWNHVRTAASIVATLGFMWGAVQAGRVG